MFRTVWPSAMTVTRHTITVLLLAKALALSAGCSPGCDDYFCIDGDDVRALPAGNATGKIVWHTELVATTTGCAGQCVYPGYPRVDLCSIGQISKLGSVRFLSDEGVLVVDDLGSLDWLFSRLRGGLNADGSFDAGSVEQSKPTGPYIMRMRGRIDAPKGSVRAVLNERNIGTITEYDAYDCWSDFDVTGTLISPP